MANIFNASQFKDMNKPQGSLVVSGSNSNMVANIGNTGYKIQVAPLMSAIVSQLSGPIREAKINKIDTSPISQSNVLGLAKVEIRQEGNGYVDREAGKIYIDVQKIVNHVMGGMLPPIVQTPNESSSVDPDIKKSIAKKVYEAIARELADTVAHEIQHKKRTLSNISQGVPVEQNPESEAQQSGKAFGRSFSLPSQF